MSETKVFNVPDGNNSLDPALMLALSQNGGFGNGMNWMWPMFLFFMFPWLFNGGFGNGFGRNDSILANQLNNDTGRDLLLQAINGRTDCLNLLANILNTNIDTVLNGINSIQSAIQTVGTQIGLSSLQVINSILSGNASLSQQICQCCCENRLAVVEQTNQLLNLAASNFAANQLATANLTNSLQTQAAANHSAAMLQAVLNEAVNQLAMCQLTNTLTNLSERNTNSILNAIAGQNTLITKGFCDLKERELQNKINIQSDMITLLRGQISNDKLTEAFNMAFNNLNDKINSIASKQPNTVPIQWPNLIAVNNTPYNGYGCLTSFWN